MTSSREFFSRTLAISLTKAKDFRDLGHYVLNKIGVSESGDKLSLKGGDNRGKALLLPKGLSPCSAMSPSC